MEQDRRQGDAARRADRPLVRHDAGRQFRDRGLWQLPERREPAGRCTALSALYGAAAEFRLLRGSRRDRALRKDRVGDRPGRPAQLDAPVRKDVLDDKAHAIFLLWWYRSVLARSYVKGWKINPSHYV